MHPLITPAFWFGLYPAPLSPAAERIILVFFGILLVAGVVLWMLRLRGGHSKPVRRAISRLAAHLGWTGVVGLGLWFLAYERIPWLSIRAGFLLWGIWFVLGFWCIGRYVWKEIPALEARQKTQSEERKWLPKRKK